MNSISVKISAHFEVPEQTTFALGEQLLIALEGDVTTKSDSPDDEGGVETVYRVRSMKGSVVKGKGATVPLKDKTRQSVKLRSLLTHVLGLDYDRSMQILLSNADDLSTFLSNHQDTSQ